MLANVTTNAVTLKADWPTVAQSLERGEELPDIEGTFVQRLDVMIPAGLRIELVGAVNRDGPKPGHGSLQERFVVPLLVHPQPVAEVEHDSNIRSIYLF